MRIRLCPRGGGSTSTVATLAPVNRSGRGVTQAPLRADGRTSRPDTRSGLNLVDRTHDPVNRAFKEPATFGERALSRNVRTDTPAASPRSEARSRPTTQHLPDEGYGCEVCRDTGYRPEYSEHRYTLRLLEDEPHHLGPTGRTEETIGRAQLPRTGSEPTTCPLVSRP